MDLYQEFKMFYYSNIILFIVILFVIIYIIVNWENVYKGNYWNGEIVKPILISGILFLILHMILTWDDDKKNPEQNDIILPKYKLGQNENQAQNEIIAANVEIPNSNPNIQLNNKYKVVNKFDTPHPNLNANLINTNGTNETNRLNNTHHNPSLAQFSKMGQNLSHTDNGLKLSNQNIFVSHKNSSKYGIKFN